MNLSPLRKQVQCLNKDLQSQNIQIKDLIRFLNKSTPNNNTTQRYQSPRSNLKQILKLEDCFSEDMIVVGTDEKKYHVKELRESKSLKYLKPFQPIKSSHESSSKYLTSRQIPMTKSVTFHNIHNALTTRKYLKLSRPQKKTNSSCSFCRENTFGFNTIQDCSKLHKVSSKTLIQTKMTESKHIIDKPQTMIKNSTYSRSKSKQKVKQKQFSDKKTPLRELGPNEILSKNQVKSFFERKSRNGGGKQQTQSKTRLMLKDDKRIKNAYGLKR